MKNSVALVALALSLVSLGFQVQKAKPAARFDKFMVPARISEYDYRVMAANLQMIRGSIEFRDGIGVPFVHQISDDHQRLAVWVYVSEQYMPSGFDARKKALLIQAINAVASAAVEFDLPSEPKADAVRVEFIPFERSVKGDTGPYAEYVKGELTFR